MKDVIQIPVQEYEAMKETIALLKDNELLKKLDRLVDLLYKEKQQLYLGNDTSDLTTASMANAFTNEKSPFPSPTCVRLKSHRCLLFQTTITTRLFPTSLFVPSPAGSLLMITLCLCLMLIWNPVCCPNLRL